MQDATVDDARVLRALLAGPGAGSNFLLETEPRVAHNSRMKTLFYITVFAGMLAGISSAAEPALYSVNFDKGLPEKWRTGVLTSEKLPADSKQAVTAKVTDGKAENISADVNWVQGHFTIADDLYFNFRVRLTNPQWYQVFLMAKSPGAANDGRLYEAKPDVTGVAAGEWKVVSLPINSFKGLAADAVGKPPEAGKICWSYFFDSQGRDLGLTIDRVWITKGAPGTVPPAP